MANNHKLDRINSWLTLGANIGVVLGLIILIVELQQNTAQLRAGARYQFVESSNGLNALIAGDRKNASMLRRGLADIESLDADERMQFFFFFGQFLQIYSVMFELHEDKLLPDSQWRNVRMDLLALTAAPGGARIWEEFGKKGLDPKFVAYVEELRSANEASYDITKF